MTHEGTMIERLALAILNSDRVADGWPMVESRLGIPDSEGYIRNARAVLEELREPTEAMKRTFASARPDSPQTVWHECIDAALAEGGG